MAPKGTWHCSEWPRMLPPSPAVNPVAVWGAGSDKGWGGQRRATASWNFAFPGAPRLVRGELGPEAALEEMREHHAAVLEVDFAANSGMLTRSRQCDCTFEFCQEVN